MGFKLSLPLLLAVLAGCAEGHCRRNVDAPGTAQPPAQAESEANAKPADADQVLVYKYDGSLQCQKGKAVSPEAMAKELQGIPIKTMSKKRDGMIHIQVCDSITGKANVYSIPAKFLKQAEGKGFKKWTFE